MNAGSGYFGDEDDENAGASDSGTGDQPAADKAPESEPSAGAHEGEGDEPSASAPAAEAAAPGKFLDLDGKKYSSGYKLTDEDIDFLERGAMRNKDYTSKTQKLNEIHRNLEGTYKRMLNDPEFFFKYFPKDHVAKFMGLNGQPSAPAPKPSIDLSRFEPEAAQVIEQLLNQVTGLQGKVGDYDSRFKKFEERFTKQDDFEAQQTIQTEMNGALKVYPQFNNPLDLRYMWTALAASPEKSLLQVASELDELKKTHAPSSSAPAVPARKPPRVLPPGVSVPPADKRPQTFDEANASAHARLGVPYRP